LRHVVFDLDGTLVDSRADLAAAVNAGLAALGCTALPESQIVSFIGDGTARLVARALYAAAGPASAGEEVLTVFHEYYAAHLLDRTCLYAGIAELLATLQNTNVRVSVLTNKNEGHSRAILRGLAIQGLIGEVVGGDTLGVLKPAPAGLRQLIETSTLPAHATAMVGDSVVDMEVARRAGVVGLGVAWGFGPSEALKAAGAQRILQRPAELQSGSVAE
jgi:phosphoglycolate phosphatase